MESQERLESDFDRIYESTMDLEGRTWSNVSGDKGKETYRGISRKAFPNLDLWELVDAGKTRPNFPANLEADASLQSQVKAFYKAVFWKGLGCEYVAPVLALELFDFGVNSGIKPAVKCLQRVLNVMNKGGSLWPDVKPDGNFGTRETLPAVKAFVARYGWDKLARFLNFMQAARFFEILEKDQSQETFAFGWLDKRC